MKRTIIFAAISIALAFVIKKWGSEPCLFNEYLCYLVGAMVAVFCFDLGEGERAITKTIRTNKTDEIR